jgi:glycosyltransferase involved in cell wall biosynthesis
MSKPRVLVLADYFRPGFRAGGPIVSIEAMVLAAAGEYEFVVLSRNRDLGERRPYSRDELESISLPCERVYASPNDEGLFALASLIRRIDPRVVYANSFFSAFSGGRTVVLSRCFSGARSPRWLVAPRGELQRGALGLKPLKKRAYLAAIRMARALRNVSLVATDAAEAAAFGSLRLAPRDIRVAPNLSTMPLGVREHRGAHDPLRIVWTSRISRKKQLHLALHALRTLAFPTTFDIAGMSDDASYFEECRDIAADSPHDQSVKFLGPLQRESLIQLLDHSDVFVLPTLGENYGHSICEAMRRGVVPVVGRETPFSPVLERLHPALVADSAQELERSIRSLRALTSDDFAELRMRVMDASRDSTDHLAAYRRLFDC